MMSTAGHFVSADLPRLRTVLGGVAKDVVAFEALAFSAFAVREYYEPIESDDTEEHVVEAFKDGFAMCRTIAERETGNDLRPIFDRRLMEYAQANSRGGMREAADVFRGVLQSIGKAKQPMPVYGPISLDLKGTMDAMAVVHAFAATMPKATAESLHNVAEHYGFF